MVKIQKRKFLSNLSKVLIFKRNHSYLQPLLFGFRIIHALFLVNFMLVGTNSATSNSFFSFLRQAHQDLMNVTYLPYVSSLLLFAICLLIIIPLLFLSFEDKDLCLQQERKSQKQRLLSVIGVFSLAFMILAPILLTFIIESFNISDFSSLLNHLIHIVALILSEIIIIYCRQKIIFKQVLILLLLSCSILPQLISLSLLIVASLYRLKIEQQPAQQLTYFLIVIITVVLLVGEQTLTCIGVTHLTVIVLAVVWIIFIPNIDSIFSGERSAESDNDYLLETVQKQEKVQELRYQQSLRVLSIIEKMKIEHHLTSGSSQSFEKLCCLSNRRIPKKTMIEILREKIQIDTKEDPNNLVLMIQRFQCELIEKEFSISALYQIQKLSNRVKIRAKYEEIQRLQLLNHKIQKTFLKNEDGINSQLIFKVEKKLQKFYMCIGEGIEQLLALWKIIVRKKVNQDIFQNSIDKIIQLQSESLVILEELKQYKDVSFEADIFNYWHKIMNVSTANYFGEQHSKGPYKLLETRFVLISNNIIEDISQSIAKKITFKKQESLIGMKISHIFYDFYNSFIQKQLDNLVSTNINPKEMMIPFRIVNHDKMFLPCSCTFKILPSISQGVKCIINFVDKKEDRKKFVLYCLETDTVEGFSITFFEKYKIDEKILPEIISGQQLFNTVLSDHITEETLLKGMIVKCELKFNDLRKHTKSARGGRYSIPLTLVINEVYSVKGFNYILFELSSRQNTTIVSAHQTIQHFVSSAKHESTKTTSRDIQNDTFCRIRNPLESVIEDKLSRIGSFSRLSYFKVAVALVVLMVLLLTAILIYVKIGTAAAGDDFSNQMKIVSNTSTLVQTVYQLFYQYYQYYQISNYPQQLLQIQNYNISNEVLEYKNKVNQNINVMMPLIISNQNPENSSIYSLKFNSFQLHYKTKIINLVDFLENVKESLITNDPKFLIENQNAVKKIVNSFFPLNNQTLQSFSSRISAIFTSNIIVILLLCIVVKLIYLKIIFFKWNVFQIYSDITDTQASQYANKLEQFINLLVNSKNYDKKKILKVRNGSHLKGFSTKDMLSDGFNSSEQAKEANQIQQKGIKTQRLFDKIIKNNTIFLFPIMIIAFFFFYYQQVDKYSQSAASIINYSADLQNLSIMILEKANDFYQSAMESLLPLSIQSIQELPSFFLATELHRELPDYFKNYKILENNMLHFNMCAYAYLNTGSLYQGIDCSKILDGMMNKGFSETYVYLLHKIDDQSGVAISNLGSLFRPSAKYPFFMQVSYSRRTINNMLVYIQKQFNAAVEQFFIFEQKYLQALAWIGFFLIPFGLSLLWILNRHLRKECALAIKCFRILPRSFIMKISVSKKLKNLKILDQIEFIAS